MRPSMCAILVGCAALCGCGSAKEFRTVDVVTPNGTYAERVGITPTPPTQNPDGTPYVAPTYVRRPMTVHTPNSTSTVDVSVPE